jgi:predicted Zn-dependent protease
MTDLRRLSGLLLDAARVAGAQWSEVVLTETTTRIAASRRDPCKVQGPELSASLRVGLDDGRVGRITRANPGEPDATGLAERAVAAAKKAEPDPFDLPTEKMDLLVQGLQIADPRLSRLEDGDRRDVLSYNEDAARALGRSVQVVSFLYEEILQRRLVCTSRGQDGLETGSRFRLRGSVRPSGQPGLEIAGQVESRRFADVASVPMGTDLGRRALALMGPASWPDRPMPLVLEPRVLARLLPLVATAFDADLVAAGRSFIRSDALTANQAIGCTRLHLVDDASLPGALETRAFDDRGVPPMPLPLIREGTLGALYRSPRSARRHGTRPTGHTLADGGAWPGTLVVRPGGRSRNMMFPDVGRYLVIDEILDLSGVDLASGAISLPVRVALGELGHVLGGLGTARLETTLSALFGAIQEMASDTERHGSVDTCTWVLAGLDLTRT